MVLLAVSPRFSNRQEQRLNQQERSDWGRRAGPDPAIPPAQGRKQRGQGLAT